MQAACDGQIAKPWRREGALTRRLLLDGTFNEAMTFYKYDLWHCFHLGVGKCWVVGGAKMLQLLEPDTTIPLRFLSLGRDYRAFCRRQKLSPYLRKVDRFTFGGTGDSSGSWNKGSVTSNMMRWLEDYCDRHAEEIAEDEQLHFLATYSLG